MFESQFGDRTLHIEAAPAASVYYIDGRWSDKLFFTAVVLFVATGQAAAIGRARRRSSRDAASIGPCKGHFGMLVCVVSRIGGSTGPRSNTHKLLEVECELVLIHYTQKFHSVSNIFLGRKIQLSSGVSLLRNGPVIGRFV